MVKERFVKLSRRGSENSAESVLHEGIPSHLASSAKQFIESVCLFHDRSIGRRWADKDRLRAVERSIELTRDWTSESNAMSSLVRATSDSVVGVDVLDFLVSLDLAGTATSDLETALTEGGSAWRVRADLLGLERRVDETVSHAAAMAAEHFKSGKHLSDAWAAAYGVRPDPSAAYSQSVKAVEVAAHRVVSPNDNRATLGKMVAELKSNAVKYAVILAGNGDFATKGDTDAITIARLMAQLLWTGQHDRHGNFDASKPISVSQREAEAAVHLAALLVQWFETGVIALR